MKLFKFKIVPGLSIQINGWEGTDPVLHCGDAGEWRYYSMPDAVDYTIDPVLELQEVDVVAEKATIKTLFAYKDINEAVKATIRAKYEVEDELKAIRTSDAEYIAFVDAAIAEGTAKKQALGLE
jgi:hypothetical protein